MSQLMLLPNLELEDLEYDNIPYTFKSSIKLNPKMENIIEDVYKLALLNTGKKDLSLFHLRYLKMFESLAKFYKNNDDLYELSEVLISLINSYFVDLDDHLIINDKKSLDRLRFHLGMSLILIEEVIEENDIELAYESFYQIERRLKKENFHSCSVIFNKEYNNFRVKLSIEEHDSFSSKESEFNEFDTHVKIRNEFSHDISAK